MPIYSNGRSLWLPDNWRITTGAVSPYFFYSTSYTTSTATGSEIKYYDWTNERPTSAYEDLWGDRNRNHMVQEIPPIPEPPPEAPAIITSRDRAVQLLMDHLTPRQKEQYKRTGTFDVEVNGRRYCIYSGWSGKVKLMDKDDRLLESLCIHFNNGSMVPIPDLMLAQKLMLETDETEFRRIANITPYRHATHQ